MACVAGSALSGFTQLLTATNIVSRPKVVPPGGEPGDAGVLMVVQLAAAAARRASAAGRQKRAANPGGAPASS
jgi:hypothetical protein